MSHHRRAAILALELIFAFAVLAATARAATLGDCTSHTVSGQRVVFQCGVAAVAVDIVDPRVVRITLCPDGVVPDDSSLAVLPHVSTPVAFAVEPGADTVTIRTAFLVVRCAQHPFRLHVADAAGRALLDEPLNGGLQWSGSARTFRFGIGADHLYGLGERAMAFDRRGQFLGTYNQALYGYGASAATMNINIPLLLSSRGWGLLLDNPAPGNFDLASGTPGVVAGTVESGPMRLYFFGGPDLPGVLERYAWLTGRAPMPPRWAFGYLQSKFGYRSRAEVEALVAQFRARGIPLDAVILDLYWYGQPGDMGRFTWDASHWPDPLQMIAGLLGSGVRTVLIEQPYLVTSTPNYATAAAQGYLGRTPGGAPYPFGMWAGTAGLIDFTRPAAADWWWSLHRPLIAQGVAGWWLDLGEPETHPNDMLHAGGSARTVHDAYNLVWLQSLHDHHRAELPDRRAFFLTRSGWAGMQRTGAVSWSGDVEKSFPALDAQVPMLLGMGLSGQAWHNSDIGGFAFGPTTPELYVRWMQFGAFGPLARAHGSDTATEPWGFGATAEAVCRKFLQLRQRLIPYAYTLAHEYSQRGLPMARPLVLAYPDDPQAQTLANEYLWGSAFLVAPVTTAGATSRSVYLPAGPWTNYWTNEVVDGGRWLAVPAPLEQMPLFVRAGSIVPMQNPMPSATSWALDTLMLDVFPARKASFDLYEDDGASLAWESGASAITPLSFEVLGDAARLHIGEAGGTYAGRPATRVWIAQVRHALAAPASVSANGKELPSRADSAAFAADADGWWYDGAGSRLLVKLRLEADRSADVVVNGAHLVDAPAVPRPASPLAIVARPNPVTNAATLEFRGLAAGTSGATLEVFDLGGRRVADLSSAVRQPQGHGTARWEAQGLPQGIYWARLRAGGAEARLRLVVAR